MSSSVAIIIYRFCVFALIFVICISSSVESSTIRKFTKDDLLLDGKETENVNKKTIKIADTAVIKTKRNINSTINKTVDPSKLSYNKNTKKDFKRNDTFLITKVETIEKKFNHNQDEDKQLDNSNTLNSSNEPTICKIDLNKSEHADDILKIVTNDSGEDNILLQYNDKMSESIRELGEGESDFITAQHIDVDADTDADDENENFSKIKQSIENNINKDNVKYIHNIILNPLSRDDNFEAHISLEPKKVESNNNNNNNADNQVAVKKRMIQIKKSNPVYLKDPYTMDSNEYASANSQPIYFELEMSNNNKELNNHKLINKNSNEFSTQSVESTLIGYDDEYYAKHGLDRHSRRAKWHHMDTSTIPETRVLNYEPIVEHTHAELENKIQKRYEQQGRYETPVQNYITIPLNYLSRYHNPLPTYMGLKPEIVHPSQYYTSHRHNYDNHDMYSTTTPNPEDFFKHLSNTFEKSPNDEVYKKYRHHLSEICKLCNLSKNNDNNKSSDLNRQYDYSDEDELISDESIEKSYS